ncbi:hypothetical protein L596_016102 [Steinernema carpocapsae]|uniref:Uncharacterized protein n=1 Tax=Steinernema carpocapsae TaxID=34508 RepID=A0A4V6XW94_STECR|nr:hypothetical protein L596_016102 [Steinernema carpocapsae]
MSDSDQPSSSSSSPSSPTPTTQFTTPRSLTAGYKTLPPPTTPRKRACVNNLRLERLKTDSSKLHKTARRRIF